MSEKKWKDGGFFKDFRPTTFLCYQLWPIGGFSTISIIHLRIDSLSSLFVVCICTFRRYAQTGLSWENTEFFCRVLNYSATSVPMESVGGQKMAARSISNSDPSNSSIGVRCEKYFSELNRWWVISNINIDYPSTNRNYDPRYYLQIKPSLSLCVLLQ